MGTVNRAGRLALVSVLMGAAVAACGAPAPTGSFQTKQLVGLGGYGWAVGADALSAEVSAAISEIQPVTTNIVGTAPWLGFPGPGALAAGLASPWPTFAGNIGTASMMNAQMGYILGLGPLGVPVGAFNLVGINALGLASPAGIFGYAGLPFVGPVGNVPPVTPTAAAIPGVPNGVVLGGPAIPPGGMAGGMPGMMPGAAGMMPGMQAIPGQMPIAQQQAMAQQSMAQQGGQQAIAQQGGQQAMAQPNGQQAASQP